MVNLNQIMGQMSQQGETIWQFTKGISDEQARWKPSAEAWSILEVICHLADEEREDFRARLRVILADDPDQKWQPIDPEGWVEERNYNEGDLPAAIDEFLEEREASLAWLGSLTQPNWQTSYLAPWGEITAGDMLTAWVAHDLLHLRQLVELHYHYLAQQSKPFSPRYAGIWQEDGI